MSYLLDTNIISELRKPEHRAAPAVRRWVAARPAADLHLSAITILEIEVGIGRIDTRDSTQALRLRRWLEDEVLDAFAGRILPVDLAVARRAARLHVPDPRPDRDALIAGTALAHALTVVTRNTEDFAALGVPSVDPWGPTS